MRASTLLVLLSLSVATLAQPALAKTSKAPEDTGPKDADATISMNDPWEKFNHPIFDFNLAVDKHIAKPIISVYDLIPPPGRHSVSNFLTNLGEPLDMIHGILQLNPKAAFTSLWRFLLNTTFGLGGIDDFARENAGLRHIDQNMGKTLGHWGAPAGPYVVLPLLGPSSVRDTTGKVGDWFADPVAWVETTPEKITQAVADAIDERDTKASVVEHLYYQSLDPYTATRSAYRQHEAFEEKTRD